MLSHLTILVRPAAVFFQSLISNLVAYQRQSSTVVISDFLFPCLLVSICGPPTANYKSLLQYYFYTSLSFGGSDKTAAANNCSAFEQRPEALGRWRTVIADSKKGTHIKIDRCNNENYVMPSSVVVKTIKDFDIY